MGRMLTSTSSVSVAPKNMASVPEREAAEGNFELSMADIPIDSPGWRGFVNRAYTQQPKRVFRSVPTGVETTTPG